MTRNGKIARLPAAVRKELNRRLAGGEPETQFDSVPILCDFPSVTGGQIAQKRERGPGILFFDIAGLLQFGGKWWEAEPNRGGGGRGRNRLGRRSSGLQ